MGANSTWRLQLGEAEALGVRYLRAQIGDTPEARRDLERQKNRKGSQDAGGPLPVLRNDEAET
jgi:hypothetical protein